jgi:hypothetical protein
MNPTAKANQFKSISQIKSRIAEIEAMKFEPCAPGKRNGSSGVKRELRQLRERLAMMESPRFYFGRYEALPVPSPLLNEA